MNGTATLTAMRPKGTLRTSPCPGGEWCCIPAQTLAAGNPSWCGDPGARRRLSGQIYLLFGFKDEATRRRLSSPRTFCVIAGDVLPLELASPPYTAVTLCRPLRRVERDRVAD